MTRRAIIDDREAQLHPLWTEDDLVYTDVPGTFIKEGYRPEVRRLASADLRLELEAGGDWVGIELKNIADWISTLRDKGQGRTQSRLRHQVAGLLGLKAMGVIPALLLIGTYTVDGNKIKYGTGRRKRTYSASWAEIETSLVALEHMGIFVMRCPDMDEVPHAASLLANQLARADHFSDGGLPRVGALSPRMDRLATTLTAVGGLGRDRALAIAERYRTFPGFYGATVEDLQKTEGVGKVLARRIWDHFHDETDAPSNPFDPDFDPLG